MMNTLPSDCHFIYPSQTSDYNYEHGYKELDIMMQLLEL